MSTAPDLNVSFDAEGFMTDPNEWTPEIAAVLASEEGIDDLTDQHWVVINFVRDEYAKTGQSPTLRSIGKRSGVNTKELYALYPKGRPRRSHGLPGWASRRDVSRKRAACYVLRDKRIWRGHSRLL